MREKLELLGYARNNLKITKELYQLEVDRFEKEHKDLRMDIEARKMTVQQLEEEIRELAINEYNIDEIKKFDCGVGIRITKVLEYDKDKAFDWAIEHNLCLTLDKKNFEKLAKIQSFDFVEVKDKVTATIPTKIEVD